MHLLASISENPLLIKDIILSNKFTKIYALIDEDAEKNFTYEDERLILLSVNSKMRTHDLSEALKSLLAVHLKEDKIIDLDIAVYISAGKGKENAALMSAVMKLGYGIRLIDYDTQVIEL